MDIQSTFLKTPVKDVMTKPVITIQSSAAFSEVEEKFSANKIRHLPVVDPAGKLFGLVTKRDLFRTLAPRKSPDGNLYYSPDTIAESGNAYYSKEALDKFELTAVMVKEVFKLTGDAPLTDALELIVKKKIGCVPIVDAKGSVTGIITRYDLLKLLADQL